MIGIIQAEKFTDELAGEFWSCWLEISQGSETWLLPATAPGTLVEAELQPYFDAHEAELWAVAQAKRYPADLFERVPVKRILKAFALVTLDEINILRGVAGLQPRTADQIVTAIKNKLKG